jgi:hypothetical protein
MQAWRALDNATVETTNRNLWLRPRFVAIETVRTGTFTLRSHPKVNYVGVGGEHRGNAS